MLSVRARIDRGSDNGGVRSRKEHDPNAQRHNFGVLGGKVQGSWGESEPREGLARGHDCTFQIEDFVFSIICRDTKTAHHASEASGGMPELIAARGFSSIPLGGGSSNYGTLRYGLELNVQSPQSSCAKRSITWITLDC